MSIKWKDVTSYQQGQTDRTPRAWRYDISGISIVVVSRHIANKGRWSLRCAPWFDVFDLGMDETVPAELAQQKALSLVRKKLKSIIDQLQEPTQ